MTQRATRMAARVVLVGTALLALSLTAMEPAAAAGYGCRSKLNHCRAKCERRPAENPSGCLKLCGVEADICMAQKGSGKTGRPWPRKPWPWPWPRHPKGGPTIGDGKGDGRPLPPVRPRPHHTKFR